MAVKMVVDSSVILKWLFQENEANLDVADALLKSSLDGKVTSLAPELAKYEVGNVLLTAKKLTAEQGMEAMEVLYALPIRFVPESGKIAKETFVSGVQGGVTYYDASFVALAKQEKRTLEYIDLVKWTELQAKNSSLFCCCRISSLSHVIQSAGIQTRNYCRSNFLNPGIKKGPVFCLLRKERNTFVYRLDEKYEHT